MEDTQEFFAYCEGRSMMVRVANPHCLFCGEIPRISEPIVYDRIGGDSGNGYQPYHRACLDARKKSDELELIKRELIELRMVFTSDWPSRNWAAIGVLVYDYAEITGSNGLVGTIHILIRDLTEAIDNPELPTVWNLRAMYRKYIQSL